MTEKDIYSFWQRGIPLSTAHLELASKEQREQLDKLRSIAGTAAIWSRLAKRVGADKVSLHQAIAEFTTPEIREPTDELRNLETQIEQHAFRQIREHNLLAYGFACPRKSNDQPVLVPPDLWSGFRGWNKGDHLEHNGLRIEAIKLIPAHWLHSKDTPRQGRPSRTDEIKSAYEQLKEMGQIDFKNSSLKAVASQVSEYAQISNPSHPDGDKGLSYLTVRKVILDDFHAEKEAVSNL